MLTKLSIQNYALIEDVSIIFLNGFTTISGETGAGKSILLGGLGLILGNRAESNILLNTDLKCVIEGEFDISNYNLNNFFINNDLDYEELTIIRREVLPSGKSRAFVNDTPVKLAFLNQIKSKLIDVHSQHQTLQLTDVNFHFEIIDAIANNESLIFDYKNKLKKFDLAKKEYQELKEKIQLETDQHDYHSFLYDELENANFKEGEQKQLESDIDRLNNTKLINDNLNESFHLLSDEEMGLQTKTLQIKQNLDKIRNFSENYESLAKRFESIFIEFTDIEIELASLQENEDFGKNEIQTLNDRLQLLYNLFQKHKVDSIKSLAKIQDDLSNKILNVDNASQLLERKKSEILNSKKALVLIGEKLFKTRNKITNQLEKHLKEILQKLGMPYAEFSIVVKHTDVFYKNGMDEISFLFNANKGGQLGSIKQTASGGELSRIMLAVKSVMANYSKLPTVIFDEIDSGISGEISLKMAAIMQKMAHNMQVIAITHLPQIVAKGKQHYRVFKYEDNQNTKTSIKKLNKEERVIEIAEMLGGKDITQTALNHANQLLD